MHLLFADRMAEQTVAELEARGHVCVMEPGLAADELPDRVRGFDGLVVRSTKVRRAVFEAADRLVLVIRAGAGTNTIDTDAAASHGVFVCNVPGRNAPAVAELTMGLLLAIDRRIADNVSDLRSGHWDKHRYSKAEGLLGLDDGHHRPRLHRLRRRRARGRVRHPGPVRGQAGSCPARGRSRAEELGITMVDSIEELVSTSDIVSLHVPSNADTKHLVDDALPGPDEEGRDPAEHLPGRRGRRARPARGPGRGPRARRPGRVRRRTGLRQGLVGLAPRQPSRRSSRPTTSAPPRTRPSARSRRA